MEAHKRFAFDIAISSFTRTALSPENRPISSLANILGNQALLDTAVFLWLHKPKCKASVVKLSRVKSSSWTQA